MHAQRSITRHLGFTLRTLLALAVLPALMSVPSLAGSPGQAARSSVGRGELPLRFEENLGQSLPEVRFLARAGGYRLALAESGLELDLLDAPGHAPDRPSLRLIAVGADPSARIEGSRQLPGKVHYLVGADPDGWVTGVLTYSEIRYAELYQGIDLLVSGDRRHLVLEMVVAPGADEEQIVLEIQGGLFA